VEDRGRQSLLIKAETIFKSTLWNFFFPEL